MSEVAEVLARAAIAEARRSTQTIMGASQRAQPSLTGDVESQVERAVYQDPARTSWRVWGGVWSGLTALLVLPEVQTAIGAVVGVAVPPVYLPVATAVLGAVWPIISKARDQRPTRPARESEGL